MYNKKNILICLAGYLPGFKSGGPLQTIRNLVNNKNDLFNYVIFTRDRDLGDTGPYPGISLGQRIPQGNATCVYFKSSLIKILQFFKAFREQNYDLLYLQSLWNPFFTLLPLIFNLFTKRRPVILAPRGELSINALNNKGLKKKIFLILLKALRFKRNILFQASTPAEAEDIKRVMGKDARIYTIMDIPDSQEITEIKLPNKNGPSIKICFLARICRHKNLHNILSSLINCGIDIEFDIYGPLEEKDYWIECQNLIKKMPNNICVKYCGEVVHENVLTTLEKYDIYCLFSKSENFSHSIHEALHAGVPVISSDQTPWNELEKRNCGWVIPLNAPEKIAQIWTIYNNLSDAEKLQMRHNAQKYGRERYNLVQLFQDVYAMFNDTIYSKNKSGVK